ncbi:MAG: hypothetical protein IJS50_05315, partial [Desulfovibrio sp.]|nr:hypothetical protein [Desulfovibrio sp.]
MKKAPLLVLLILVGLAACAGLGLQFWVKPAVEQEIATILNNYFEKQGAKPKGPVKVTLNPLARVLTIAPLDLKLNPAMQLRDGQVALTTLKLTLKGMLALSPLSNLVSGSEEKVILLEQVSCPSVNVNFIEGNYKAKGLIAYNLAAQGSDLQDLQKNPQNFDKKRIFYVQKVHLAETKVQVPSGNKTLNLDFGAMDFSEITPKLLGKVEVAGLNIREGEHEVFRARQISYENLRLYSEEEWLNMAQSLLQASDEVKLERLANLFLGDEPLLEKVNLNDLTVDVEGSPLAIGRVSFEAKPQATLNRLEVHGLALASSLFEKAFKQKLPLPKLLHLGFGLGLSKLANEERTFSFNLGIDE